MRSLAWSMLLARVARSHRADMIGDGDDHLDVVIESVGGYADTMTEAVNISDGRTHRSAGGLHRDRRSARIRVVLQGAHPSPRRTATAASVRWVTSSSRPTS